MSELSAAFDAAFPPVAGLGPAASHAVLAVGLPPLAHRAQELGLGRAVAFGLAAAAAIEASAPALGWVAGPEHTRLAVVPPGPEGIEIAFAALAAVEARAAAFPGLALRPRGALAWGPAFGGGLGGGLSLAEAEALRLLLFAARPGELLGSAAHRAGLRAPPPGVGAWDAPVERARRFGAPFVVWADHRGASPGAFGRPG